MGFPDVISINRTTSMNYFFLLKSNPCKFQDKSSMSNAIPFDIPKCILQKTNYAQ